MYSRPSSLTMHRRGFLTGAGAAGMALGTGLGTAYTQIAAAPDYTLRIAPLRLELAPNKIIETWIQWDRPRSGIEAARRSSSEHRYPQRHGYRRHHPLARALRALGGRRCHGGRLADGGARRHSALHLLAKPTGTRWYHSHNPAETDLSRSLYGGLYGFMIIEPSGDPAPTTGKCCLPRITGRAVGSACRTSAGDHRQTTASRCCTNPHRSTTRCSVMASPSGFARVNAFCFGYSMPAQLKTLLSLYPATALPSSRLMEIRCPHNAPSTHCFLPRRNGSMRSWR